MPEMTAGCNGITRWAKRLPSSEYTHAAEQQRGDCTVIEQGGRQTPGSPSVPVIESPVVSLIKSPSQVKNTFWSPR